MVGRESYLSAILYAVRITVCLLMAVSWTAAHAETPADSHSQEFSLTDGAASQPATEPVAYLSPDNAPKLPPPPRHYSAPAGFAGHKWGEPRKSFSRLPEKPAGISAAWSRGVATMVDIDCRSAGPAGCSIEDYLRAARSQRFEGGGFHVLSEYYIESQGFKFPGTGVVLSPVVYQFCANWKSEFRDVPKDIEQLNKFCGVRMLFDTETRAQLRDLPEDHVTRYDLVLAELISHFGKPANFTWRGHVLIEPVSATAGHVPRGERKFDTWRWCPAPPDGLMTRCVSSIVLTLDPDLGRGIVLLSTPELWQYAAARENGPAQPDPLYTLLHALSLKYRTAYAKRQAELHALQREAEARKTGYKATGSDGASPNEAATLESHKEVSITRSP
jgi:hypothetical protein